MFHLSPFARGLNLACYAAIFCISLSLTAHAQQPSLPPLPPAKSASEPSAMERSRRQSENVYKFIKQFADTPRKPSPVPSPAVVRPKEEVVTPAPVRRPEPLNAANPSAATEPQPSAAPDPVTSATAITPVSSNSGPAQASSAPAPTAAPEPAAVPVAPAVAAAEEEEDEELQLITQVDPNYPRGMQGAPDSGKVTVALTIQPDGSVSETSVVTASHRRFGKPASDAVAQWRFAPIKTARTVRVEIVFNPRGDL